MKKEIKNAVMLLMLTIGFVTIASAQNPSNLNSKQLLLRNQIQSFLKTEGFQPTLDDDGDIKFKRQGNVYFIRVNSSDEDPMFVSVSKYFNYSDAITRTKIMLFNDGENDYKMCKIVPGNNAFIIKAEMFLTTSSSFTDIFYRILKVMDGAEDAIGKI